LDSTPTKEAYMIVANEKTAARQWPNTRERGTRALAVAVLTMAVVLAITSAGRADSTPVGPLPAGPVSTVTTAPDQLVAVALPRGPKSSGLVWRIARAYNTTLVRQVSEADVGANVVLVFRVIHVGSTSLVFALTRGDTSAKALRTATQTIVSR
jgi:hypothetical protein